MKPLILCAFVVKNFLANNKILFRTLFFWFLQFSSTFLKAEKAFDIIQSKRVAISVSATRMYSDSMYTAQTEKKFNEGDLFEIIGETTNEHSDNTQNQTFKWYRVRTLNGEVGWVFGDNLATILPEYLTDSPLRSFYKRAVRFDNGFENAIMWVASTDGHDDKFKTQSLLNPAYKEFYLVITNSQGKSVSINYANISETGKRDVVSFFLKDVTDNGINELIFETKNFSSGSNTIQRQIEIFSFKPGGLMKIFEERTDLQNGNKENSPAICKFIDIDSSSIRISYVDFVDCSNYTAANFKTDIKTKTQEQCMEYVTYTLQWNKRSRTFTKLYPLSRAPIPAQVKAGTYLIDVGELTKMIEDKKSTYSATPINQLSSLYLLPQKNIFIIKVFNNFIVKKNGEKELQCYFYVNIGNKQYGYVFSNDITITDVEHAALLNYYFTHPTLNISDFRPTETFLHVR